jgi:hypothetical protein
MAATDVRCVQRCAQCKKAIFCGEHGVTAQARDAEGKGSQSTRPLASTSRYIACLPPTHSSRGCATRGYAWFSFGLCDSADALASSNGPSRWNVGRTPSGWAACRGERDEHDGATQ